MKIGLSYDEGTPKYRLYTGALIAAAERANIDATPLWLAGAGQALDETALQTIDGLILTGGADVEPSRYGRTDAEGLCTISPGRDDVELRILKRAIARRLPILAICRGMQLLNVLQGGSLIPDLATRSAHQLPDEQRHPVNVDADSALAILVGTLTGDVTSSHHQAVDRLGEDLRVSARHADGTVESIEWTQPMRKPWLAAVQWHPERMGPDEPLAGPIYKAFLQAVAASHG
ncbi:MAG: gamma-glutamyl-gamma-aminobutyrate hydrolase family protein [bacterium]|nr:gamma-glutamyl-gamma-aminobutyrate hydrolase family protein [bacterium]